jgi:hypothetical protein
MTIALALFAITVSRAQSEPELTDGKTLLSECFANPSCDAYLSGILGENMTEYGFALQFDPIATSAIAGKGYGFVTELHIDTVPLGEGNDVSKRLLIPPAVPRIAVGYQYGSFTYDDPYPQLAFGAFILPPVSILDGLLFSTGAHVGASVPLYKHILWGALELDGSWAHITAPLVGSEQQLSQLAPLEDRLSAGTDCPTLTSDCFDQFNQSTWTARTGLSVEPFPGAFFYGRLAAALLRQRLYVAYDRTTWQIRGLQPQAQIGAGVRAGDKYQLTTELALANKPAYLSTNDSRLMAKVVTSFSFRFGHARYWENKEIEDDS